MPETKNHTDEQKQFEYSYLRAEIEANKRLIFERALLIAGLGLMSTFLPDNLDGIELIGLPAIGALAFNLWFTYNRLDSNMRIIAYIQLFHEPSPESEKSYRWIGWENALRKYRVWMQGNRKKNEETMKTKNIPQYDNLSFYKPILLMHIVMAFGIALFMSVRLFLTESLTTDKIPMEILLGINGIAAVGFMIWSLIKYMPSKLQYGIEKNRIRWEMIFNSSEEKSVNSQSTDEDSVKSQK